MSSDHRGPFEASGLGYSSSANSAAREPSAKAAEAALTAADKSVPELAPDLLVEEPSHAPPAIPPALPFTQPFVDFELPALTLTLPPTPPIPKPTRNVRPIRWRSVWRAVVPAAGLALLGVSAAWAYARVPPPSEVATPPIETSRDDMRIPASWAAGRRPMDSNAAPITDNGTSSRARNTGRSRSDSFTRIASTDPAITDRTAALPPPRRASTPLGSATAIAVQGQTCALRCRRDVQCLLACRPEGSNAPRNALVGAEPTREQIEQAMTSVRGGVLLCAMSLPANAPDAANVRVSFDSTGRATFAIVELPIRGTTVGDCIQRAVERARVPPFEAPSFTVRHAFTLR